VISHGGCPDGVAAAYAFNRIPELQPVYYHWARERDFFKDTKIPNLVGKIVYIVDFSYSRGALLHIGSIADVTYVLDHHETAQKALSEPIQGVNLQFDMSRCGAEMTWDHFNLPRPWWLKHIRDKDLWKWGHPNSREFGAALIRKSIRFETFEMLDNANPQEIEAFYNEGASILAAQQDELDDANKWAQLVQFEGYPVLAAQSGRLRSEIGNLLAKRPECRFAFIYTYDMLEHKWCVSLRGIAENNINLCEIAAKYGGGGHPLACGFTFSGDIKTIILTPSALSGDRSAGCSC
jgi:oligoribonuclease NrnB/cAMP/cGMP phosphodiesterase (DHH superfamily)